MRAGFFLCLAIAVVFMGECSRNTPTNPRSSISHIGAMVYLPAGTFIMGTADSIANPGAQPPHQVTVSAFYMDTVDVTQNSFQQVMGFNPASLQGDSMRPVETVSWYDAVLYCNARSKLDNLDTVYGYLNAQFMTLVTGPTCTSMDTIFCDFTRHGYRLPTEAEYEYACRAGTTTTYFWGSDSNLAGTYAWYGGNAGGTSHPVATKLPNQFGLYDMVGNVWLWVNDLWGSYSAAAQTNPTGPITNSDGGRTLRGGSWGNDAYYGYTHLTSAARYEDLPNMGYNDDGFRCVRR